MIYITGDCHGDFKKLSSSRFKEQKELNKSDFVIICGDFGLWHDTAQERYWLNWLDEKPFTTVFIDGNHENFDRLYGGEFEAVDFHGGKAHKIRSSIYHLMRGYVFELCGKKIFAFGGASSHDIKDGIVEADEYDSRTMRNKMIRINHVSWWKEELPSCEEMDFGLKSLADNNNTVDYIVTHCLPQNIACLVSGGLFKEDELTNYFDIIAEKMNFEKWFCGHYHVDYTVLPEYQILYNKIIRIV